MGVALYFSASWCPPCKLFTPLLIDAYSKIQESYGQNALEIILVPRDRTRDEWTEYIAPMPWLTFPFDHPSIFMLKSYCDITQLPQLVVLDRSSNLICKNARGDDGFGFERSPVDVYLRLHRSLRKRQNKGDEGADFVNAMEALD